MVPNKYFTGIKLAFTGTKLPFTSSQLQQKSSSDVLWVWNYNCQTFTGSTDKYSQRHPALSYPWPRQVHEQWHFATYLNPAPPLTLEQICQVSQHTRLSLTYYHGGNIVCVWERKTPSESLCLCVCVPRGREGLSRRSSPHITTCLHGGDD